MNKKKFLRIFVAAHILFSCSSIAGENNKNIENKKTMENTNENTAVFPFSKKVMTAFENNDREFILGIIDKKKIEFFFHGYVENDIPKDLPLIRYL